METITSTQYSRERVPLENLITWFEENKQPKIDVRGLLPVAFAATIWLADLASNLLNIVSAMWFSAWLPVPPVISGLISPLFLDENAHARVPAFVQVLVLLLVQGGGMLGVWVLAQRSTWPQWVREGSRAFRPEEIPIRAQPTKKGVAMGLVFLLFWLFFAHTFGTTGKFLAGIESGALKPIAYFQHLWVILLLFGVMFLRKIVEGDPKGNATRIRICASDIGKVPLLLNLDETCRPGFPVLADFDPELRAGILVLYRKVGASGQPYEIANDGELDLTANDIFLFNMDGWRSRFNEAPETEFDEGEDGLYRATTAYFVPIVKRDSAETEKRYRISPESVDIFHGIATGNPEHDRQFEACRDSAVRKFIDAEDFLLTANQLRTNFAFVKSYIQKAGNISTEPNSFIDRACESLNKSLDEVVKRQEEWQKTWNKAEQKLKQAYDQIPLLFDEEAKTMLKPNPPCESDKNAVVQQEEPSNSPIPIDLRKYIQVKLKVKKFVFRDGLGRDLTRLFTELIDRLTDDAALANKSLAEWERLQRDEEARLRRVKEQNEHDHELGTKKQEEEHKQQIKLRALDLVAHYLQRPGPPLTPSEISEITEKVFHTLLLQYHSGNKRLGSSIDVDMVDSVAKEVSGTSHSDGSDDRQRKGKGDPFAS